MTEIPPSHQDDPDFLYAPYDDAPYDEASYDEASDSDAAYRNASQASDESIDSSASEPPRRARVIRPRPTRADVVFYALLALVVAVAGWLRFDHQNWDDFTHLHPDERFLTEVVSLLNSPTLTFTEDTTSEQDAHRLRCLERYPAQYAEDDPSVVVRPAGIGGYFDAECSALNPNNLGKGLYVYGEMPLFAVHAAGVARSQLSRDIHAYLEAFDPDEAADHTITTFWEGYTGAQLIGRNVAGLADWLTVLVIFLIGRRLYGRWVGLLAAGLYGFAALPLQLSSFWTVDSFATFWVTLTIYFAVRALDGASAIEGPRPLLYLALWAVAVGWQVGAGSLPVLGLVTLGGIFLAVLAVMLGLNAWSGGALWARYAVAGSAVIASLGYLVGWLVLGLAAEHDFTLANDLQALGLVSLVLALAALIGCAAADSLRHRSQAGDGERTWERDRTLALGALGLMEMALLMAWGVGGIAGWPALFMGLSVALLLVFDANALTDYAWFGVALGAAVASRINMAPLAGIIVLVALIRMLPLLDARLDRIQRNRIVTDALLGVMVAALLSLVTLRMLHPHVFLGPGFFGLRFNPGWLDDASEAATQTSGSWDAPPNHQWADRVPYLFPLRNIIAWGLGIPLGVVAWLAWAWAGVAMLRARRDWTRHAIPFVWILVIFGWLGGRWVTTMRYFLPLYPMLVVLAAWAVVTLLERAWAAWSANRRAQARRGEETSPRTVMKSRWAVGAAVALAALVIGYTVVYGLAFQNIHRHQLTRVAASRWFQETVPGDFGLWVEGEDGERQLINLGRGYVSTPPTVSRVEDGQTVTFAALPDQIDGLTGAEAQWTIQGEFVLSAITLRRMNDPLNDPEPEVIRASLYRSDPDGSRALIYQDVIREDFAASEAGVSGDVYGRSYTLTPETRVTLGGVVDPNVTLPTYALEIAVIEGGPVTAVSNVVAGTELIAGQVSVTMVNTLDSSVYVQNFNFPSQPLLTGHGDDIPDVPTQWTVGSSTTIQFPIPIDGVIREVQIPHLGDVLGDADTETLRLMLSAGGMTTTATLTGDFSAQGDNSLGGPQTLTFDPPLEVQHLGADGSQQYGTLYVEPQDPIYTSGPVIAWEGDWDDPVPWATCPLPDDMQYRDDLPSGLSDWTCAAISMYGSHYQGIKLWMSAEDNEQKRDAIQNALDQADYLVITSNRFYDSLARVPYRWPMSLAFYDALFDGSLGFDLIRTFESPPTLGPITFKDQILPTDDLPDWLNNYWESEEAFSVYDHPVVLVFQKTADYSPEHTQFVLDGVSIRSIATQAQNYIADALPVNVIPWGADRASEVPTLLQLTPDKARTQTLGGTWSDLFPRSNPLNQSQPLAVIVWWLLMVIAGWVAWPLLAVMLPALPDRGYAASKITGWLLVAWIAWAGGTLGARLWSRGGLLLILLALVAGSSAISWRRRETLRAYVRANWRYMLAVEALTLGLFALGLIVRLGNPDLWHYALGGEKPMDFAYFNAVLRSTVFPPYDPWFSGGMINYYYFGYVVVGAPVKLLGLNPSVAYNLIIPTLFAMTGIGVFAVAYNWVRARAVTPGAVECATRDGANPASPLNPANPAGSSSLFPSPIVIGEGPGVRPDAHEVPQAGASVTGAQQAAPLPERRAPRGSAWAAGLLAVLLAVILGNLGELHLFVTAVAQMDGWERQPLYDQYRTTQLEAERSGIYQDYYDELVEDFKDEHNGRAPESQDELFQVANRAQTQTDEYITDQSENPSILKQWSYDLDNTLDQLRHFAGGMDDFLSGTPLPLAPNRWYWAPTRIINELPGGAGQNAIAEMPYFTFLYGDLHAHMMAFPITMLVLLWLLSEIIGAGLGLRTGLEAFAALALGALAVGVLRPTNSWDWITYLLLGVAGLTFAAWLDATRASAGRVKSLAARQLEDWLRPGRVRETGLLLLIVVPLAVVLRVGYYLLLTVLANQQEERGLKAGETLIDPSLTAGSVILWVVAGLALAVALYGVLLIALRAHINRDVLVGLIGRVAGFVILSMVAALPFTQYFATAYTKILPWERETTPLWAFLYVHGLLIFLVFTFLIWQTVRGLRRARVADLQGQLVPVSAIVGGLIVVTLGAWVWGARDVPVAALVVPLIAWTGVMFFLPAQAPLLRVIYALIIVALAIALGVELVVLDGDIGRQNTVFKFYLQVWLLLSVVGGVVLAWMLHAQAILTGPHRWPVLWRGVWQVTLLVLITLAAMYPVLATQGRWQDRFDPDVPTTLDGMDYMKTAVHSENGISFALRDDYELIRWLQDNVEGTPVIAEAQMPGMQYRWAGRISIYTGFPTLLGWSWHQIQQHSVQDMDKLVHNRENNIAALYQVGGEEGIDGAITLIRHYDVGYIVVGTLERIVYYGIVRDPTSRTVTVTASAGLDKFDTMVERGLLEVVYDRAHCVMPEIEDVAACPAEQVTHDVVYRVQREIVDVAAQVAIVGVE